MTEREAWHPDEFFFAAWIYVVCLFLTGCATTRTPDCRRCSEDPEAVCYYDQGQCHEGG